MTWTQIAILVMTGIAITESLTCSSDADCTTKHGEKSECNILEPCLNGTCVCMDGYQFYSGTCKAEIAINAACNFSSQCGDNAECTGSVCACETAYKAEGNGVDCELIKTKIPYGDPCTVSDECATTGAYCGDGVCKCFADGFMYTGSQCQARTHGDACSDSEPCLSDLGLTCGSSSSECECSNIALKTVTSEWNGFSVTACIHNDASYNLGKGETCNSDEITEATALICKTSLFCGTCPEDANSYICLDAGASNHFAASTVLFALISAYVLSFV